LGGLEALLACELAGGGRLSILTRLDRETSGLVLVAKHRRAARELSACFEERRVTREYLAIVRGWPRRQAWIESGRIRRAGEVRPGPIWLRQMIHPGGRVCRTRFWLLRCFTRQEGRFALLRCRPQTGRMHQIRVHLEAAGHPLVGDKIYGTDGAAYLEQRAGGLESATARRLVLPRHALHAARLTLDFGGRKHAWESPLPVDLTGFFEDSRLSDGDGALADDRG
jgi:23S rRNA pseudouridine1911/1915/1917 synthase